MECGCQGVIGEEEEEGEEEDEDEEEEEEEDEEDEEDASSEEVEDEPTNVYEDDLSVSWNAMEQQEPVETVAKPQPKVL